MASNSGGLRRRGGGGTVKEKEQHVSAEDGDQDSWDQILIQVTTVCVEQIRNENNVLHIR